MSRRTSVLVTLATFVATVFVALAMGSTARADVYDYTVRVFAGNRGTLPQDPVAVTVPKGGSIDLYDYATADTTGSRYVQIGFRLSGTDELLGNGKVNGISEDMDFVVAYGVESETVSYTLRFVEYGTGKELADSRTYTGRMGDKPVAAYEYIEGYRPLYLAITGTLHEDAEENVWTFEYVALEEGETIETTTTNTTTTYETIPGNTVTNTEEGGTTTTEGGTTGGGTTAGGGTAAGGGTTEGAGAATEGNEGAAGTEGAEPTEPPQTREILDLDNPLAGPDSANGAAKGPEAGSFLLNPVILSGVGIGAVVAIGAVIVVLAKRKKGEEQNEEA